MVQRFLPTISLEELNRLGATMAGGSRVLLVVGPDQMRKPSAPQLLAVERQVSASQIEKYSDASEGLQNMPKPPGPGSIVKMEAKPEFGITEWTLSNGVKVVLKPTQFKNDEVRMAAFSPGGTSLVKDADYDTARYADDVVRQGGLGTLDAVSLHKAMTGKMANVNANIGELEEELSGFAAPNDLEQMFQLIYWTMTSPRRDEPAFTAWRTRQAQQLKHRLLSPEVVFADELHQLVTQNHLRRRPSTPEKVERVDLDKALAIYKDRFGDASDFTFMFVGNFTLEQAKPLVENYLASLPAKARKETYRDVGVNWPLGVKTKTVLKGSEPKSRVSLNFHDKLPFTREAEVDLRVLREVLRLRLREVLREDMGGVYGVSVGGSFHRRPKPEWDVNISFGCLPENVEKLEAAVWEEIRAIQDHGVDESYLVKLKEARRRTSETELQDNGFWLKELERTYSFGDDPKQIGDITRFLGQATSDRVRATAKKFLSKKQYVLGVLKPEPKPQP
ncbi:MAG: insulinase family protein [Polyangiaceae bacterium]